MPFGFIGCKKSGSLKINFSAPKNFKNAKGLGNSIWVLYFFFPFYFVTLNHGKETPVTFN
jgi:hypothetical protein